MPRKRTNKLSNLNFFRLYQIGKDSNAKPNKLIDIDEIWLSYISQNRSLPNCLHLSQNFH